MESPERGGGILEFLTTFSPTDCQPAGVIASQLDVKLMIYSTGTVKRVKRNEGCNVERKVEHKVRLLRYRDKT